MKSHEVDYEIKGESIQIVEIELDPQETVIAEAGAMLFMEDGIQFETKMGDGSSAVRQKPGNDGRNICFVTNIFFSKSGCQFLFFQVDADGQINKNAHAGN